VKQKNGAVQKKYRAIVEKYEEKMAEQKQTA
jgi:hypothetical protein